MGEISLCDSDETEREERRERVGPCSGGSEKKRPEKLVAVCG